MDQLQRLTKPVLTVSAFGFLLVSLFVYPPNALFVKQPWFKMLIGSLVLALLFVDPIAALLAGVALAIVLLRVHQYELYRVFDMVDPEPAASSESEPQPVAEPEHGGARFAHSGEDLLPPPMPVTPMIRIPEKDAFISQEWLEKAQDNRVGGAEDTPFAALTKTDTSLRGLPQQSFEWYETIA